MNKVRIITDSNTCLPQTLTERYGIKILPLVLIFGEEVLLDGIDITPTEFYARLRTADPLPTTSAPSPAQFIEAFQESEAVGAKGVVVVTLSSRLSMMYQSARIAADLMRALPVEIIDSGLATMAQGFIALEAARAAEQDSDLAGVVLAAESSIHRSGFIFVLDTLEYLHRGGRVPAVASIVGSALDIHPVVGSKGDGTVGILVPAHGKERAIESMIRALHRKVADRELRALAVMHADALTEAEDLMDRLASQFNVDELYITEFSPVMAAHAGPGALGFAYLMAEPNGEDS